MSSSRDLGIVFCVHHKPWLMMSTLITTLMQDYEGADLYFAYNVGDGVCMNKPSYDEYFDLADRYGIDPQLSPYDPRVRDVCRVRGFNVHEIEFENDTTLDSGAWYKFLQTGLWRRHEHVLFLGEGSLLTRVGTLSAMKSLARARGVHFVASGHEKRRLPRALMLNYYGRSPNATPMHAFHDRMIRQTFEIFCRDPAFRAVFDRWPDDGPAATENHVPDIWPRSRWGQRWAGVLNGRQVDGTGFRSALKHGVAKRRSLILALDRVRTHARVRIQRHKPRPDPGRSGAVQRIYVNGLLRPAHEVVEVVEEGGAHFHQASEPEWFGCTVAHFFSREFLERLTERLERYAMYDALDLPYAATALETIWGLIPAWLGYDKWFTDGIHRVRKNFVTNRREDDAATMAWYINQYYRGALCVAPSGDSVKLRAWHPSLEFLTERLNEHYFVIPPGEAQGEV